MQYLTEITRYLHENLDGGFNYAVRYDLVSAAYPPVRIARATILHVVAPSGAETTVVDLAKAYNLPPEAVDAFSEMLISVQRRASVLRDFSLSDAEIRCQLKAQKEIEDSFTEPLTVSSSSGKISI